MTSKFFTSIGFSVCALIFLVLITIMHITKQKHRENQNKSFIFLLVLTGFLLISEIAYVYCMANIDKMPRLTEVLCRMYLIGAIVWIMAFLYYILTLGTREYEEEEKNKIHKKYLIAVGIIVIITSVTSCFLPLEYNVAINDIYSFSGLASYLVYVVGLASGIIMFIIFVVTKLTFPSAKKIPIRFAFVVVIVSLLVQALTGYDFNNLTYLFAFMISTLFFTIESQDSKLLAEVKASKEEAEAANKAKTQFLENMSHEIRTPMSTILGFSETLLKQKELSQEQVKEDVENIHSASITLLDLINNILDISRIDSSREELVEREYELQDLVFEVNSVFSSKINNNELTFEISVDPNLPRRYYGDYQKLTKVVLNILMNALKYTNYGKITLEFLQKETEADKFCLEIIVSNTGHEMKEEYLNFDFNDFMKIGETIEGNNIDSVTLGLGVAKQYIEMMEGKLDFKNETGKGTKYFVYVEQKVINDEKIGDIFANKSKDVPENRELDLSDKKFLIVDDNEINIKIAKRLLEGYKVVVEEAKSGQECVEKVKDTKYDLIFLDHMMPEMDGVATLNVIKTAGSALPPVIALTANSYSGIREKYLEEGFNDYLAKPINYKDLNKLIHRYFDKD